MNEQLFSAQVLVRIQKEGKANEKRYYNSLVLDGKSTETSIFTISIKKRLIFTEGNEHTGYRHLRERHAPFTYKNYWVKTEDGQIKLDRPSKFSAGMAPGIDYIKIADSLFSPKNKNITKNNHPEIFDKYTGFYADKNDSLEKYHLLTYKDTRVVHTLFPDKKKHNFKAVAKFGKGHVVATRKLNNHYDYADLLVPYENKDGITAYSILIRKFYQEQVERVFIQQHDEKGEVGYLFLLGERDINDFTSFDYPTMAHFQHRDLIDYEQVINKIYCGVENIQIDPQTFRW